MIIPFALAVCSGKNLSNFPDPHPMAAFVQDQANRMSVPREKTYNNRHTRSTTVAYISVYLLETCLVFDNVYLAVGSSLRTISKTCRASCGASACLPVKNISRWCRSALEANFITTLNSLSLLHLRQINQIATTIPTCTFKRLII